MTTELRTGEDVENWLNAIPDKGSRHRASIEIAVRAALRVAPLSFREPRRGFGFFDHWPILCVIATPWVIARFPTQLFALRQAAERAAGGFNSGGGGAYARSAAVKCAYTSSTSQDDSQQFAVSTILRAVSSILARSDSFATNEVATAFWEALSQDATAIGNQGSGTSLDKKLWEDESQFSAHWTKFGQSLPIGEDWDVWSNWYEQVSLGHSPWPEAAAVEIVTMPDETWNHGPAFVNSRIKDILANHSERLDAMPRPPDPDVALGPIIVFRNDKLAIVDGEPSQSGFDAATQGLLHARVKSRLPLLRDFSNRTNNSFPSLKLAVDEYASVTAVPLDQLDTEIFWMSGMALLTQAQAFERQDPSSGFGRLDASHQAILSEVAGLHGALIIGFTKGRMLTERAREAQLPAAEIIEPPTLVLLDAFKGNRHLLEERLRRYVEISGETIRFAGWDAARAGYGAYALVRNMLIRMGTTIVSIDKQLSKSLLVSTMVVAAVGGTSSAFGITAELVIAMIEFFRANYGSILQYAAPFPELRVWITYVMELLHHDRVD
jgi:hypothetical protein